MGAQGQQPAAVIASASRQCEDLSRICHHCASAIALVAGAHSGDPLARNGRGEFGQFPAGGCPGKALRHVRERPLRGG